MVVGKLTFDRKVMGRMVRKRGGIEKTGVCELDFEEFASTFEARAVGTEESVSRALALIIELADGCGFVPSNSVNLILL